MTKNRVSLAALLIAMLVVPATARARDAFVGTWKVVVTPDEAARKAGGKEFKDTFTFKGDQFETRAWKEKGFAATKYEEDTRAGIVASFKAVAKSTKNEGEATWTGTSTAGEMQGELVLKKTDGTELKYTIKGTRQQ
jgi:hypothetical protein